MVDPKLLHRLFYPQVPAILSAQLRDRVSAMPVVSYASVSDAPPLVVVGCIPSGFTYRLASRSGSFSLSLLNSSFVKAVETLATTSGSRAKDKLASAGLSHRKGVKLAVPIIEGADATLECKLDSKISLGDHVLLVGLVRAAYASAAFSRFWDFRRYRPILYAGWRDGMTAYPDA